MIKAVLQAVPTYSMSVFRLPKKLCNDLEAIMARFWWKQGKNESGIHWKRWEFLGESKAVGGLGFRDMENFNKAMLAKQGWRLMKMEDSLVAKIYKEKYFKNETFTEAKLGMMPSFIWRSLWSAYYAENKRCKEREGQSSNIEKVKEIWKNLWKMQIPGGWKHLVWKALHNILPTKLSLLKKKVLGEPRCPVCFQSEESVVHVLWSCPASTDVWSERGSPVQKWNSDGGGFEVLWLEMVRKLSQTDLERVVAIMHSIWFRRNAWVFESSFSSPKSVIKTTLVRLEEYQEALKDGRTVVGKIEQVKQRRIWQKPVEPSVKVNFDAAVNQKEKRMGAEVVIRDSRGDVLVSLSTQLQWVNSPFMAECKALSKAIELCKELGFYRVWFEGDAKGVVDRVNKEEEDDSWEGLVVGDLQKELRSCRGWKLSFVHRECNEVAHSLAKLGVSIDTERVWMKCVPPDSVQQVIFYKHCN
ncbi:hypothetical protein F2P56_033791 [Juglans regia]|uniref:Uncharacterized protein n=1 Tax=Juglans regia TaxID=51240 RepID=A0A833U5Z2_JUGRE|nr:hypothetical protein F2P56_033791 [Juglans regia]